jgi:hypothetical protein
MFRVISPLTAKTVVLSLATCLMLAAPARADLITLNFQGTVDFGGGIDSYNGFFTWNTAATPFDTAPGEADYALANYNLFFNGVDVTEPVSPDGRGNGAFVLNDLDLFGTGILDALALGAVAGRPHTPTGDLFLLAVLAGPTTMFDSTQLPGNLDFLSQASSRFTAFIFEPDAEGSEDFFLDTRGSLVITGQQVTPAPVPEPTSLVLLGTGLAAAGVRRWRRSGR